MKIELIPKLASERLEDSNKPVLGAEMFSEPFANIFLCARKKSGKTTVLYNILKNCSSKKKTKVVCFASTVFKDAQWLRIADYLKKKGVYFEGHMSMYDEMTGVNTLSKLMSRLQKESKQNLAKEAMNNARKERLLEEKRKLKKSKRKRVLNKRKPLRINGVLVHENVEKALKNALHSKVLRRKLQPGNGIKSADRIDVANDGDVLFESEDVSGLFERELSLAFRENKSDRKDIDLSMVDIEHMNDRQERGKDNDKVVPEWIFVFDDLSNELRDPLIAHLLKTNRHYKAKVIISSQYVQDIPPSSRKQIDYWMLFAGHSVDKLEVIFYDADTRLSLSQFIKLYKSVTREPYQFLLLNTTDDSYRRGFTQPPISIRPDESTQKVIKEDDTFQSGNSIEGVY